MARTPPTPRRVPRNRIEPVFPATETTTVPPSHTHVEADITDLSVGLTVTVSTAAPSGGGNDGDLWCRI